ncbi:MAG: hypothetical protein NZL87_09925, partial [Thermomicrobium sp.]|nr:hypothetical protein [Thermomicrobium sp.]
MAIVYNARKTGSSGPNNRPADTQQFVASAAINGPVCVSVATNLKVSTTPTSGSPRLVAGICVNSPQADEIALVACEGEIVEKVPVTGTVNAGDLLTRSSSTAGSLMAVASPSVGEVVGVALTNASSGPCTVR